MSQLGCTTPYGENKNHICTGKNSSMLALEMYLNLMDAENSCLKPCSFTTTTVSVKDLLPENGQKEDNAISKQYLHFKVFNAAQPGVGRVQVLGSKKTEEEDEDDEEQFFGHCMKDKQDSAWVSPA